MNNENKRAIKYFYIVQNYIEYQLLLFDKYKK